MSRTTRTRSRLTYRCASALLGLLISASAIAQSPSSGRDAEIAGELARIRKELDFGHFDQVLALAEARLDRGSVSDADRLELHRLAGLAAFNLGGGDLAERHFRATLRIDPDTELDPFLVPPPAVEFFARLRAGMKDELAQVRQEKREAAERAERQRLEEERRRREAEEQRRRLELMARQVVLRTEEHRSVFVNFIPFGVGQFQQARVGTGLAFAVGEVALGATSVLAFFAYEGLLKEQPITIDDRLDVPNGRTTRTLRGIPTDRVEDANRYRAVKTASAIGFYVLWAIGTGEALWHHQDTVIVERTVPASLVPRTPDDASSPPSSSFPGSTSSSTSSSTSFDFRLRPDVFALTDGAGAGFTFSF